MRHFSAALFFVVCLGCEAVVDIEAPDYSPELVATSHFSPDSIWAVAVHRSLAIESRKDARKQYVERAAVSILNGADTLALLSYQGGGWYRSALDMYPAAGTQYTLFVDLSGEAVLKAVSATPPVTPIGDASLEILGQTVETVFGREGKYRLHVRLLDPPGPSYYRLGVYRYRPNQDRLIDENAPDSVYRLQDVDIADPGWYCGYSEALGAVLELNSGSDDCPAAIVTDRLFDGKEFTWTATMTLASGGDGDGRDELVVLLSSLSEDYFEYQRTLQEQRLTGPFVEPLRVYSNVEGGLGIFAGYTNSSVILPLPK